MKKILYVDMDGVLVDFKAVADKITQEEKDKYGTACNVPNIFSKMKPIDGALEAYETLTQQFDVYILSTAAWNNSSAASDKFDWVKKYLPKLAYKRLILSNYKNLNAGDFLIDDRLKNGAESFGGKLIHFGSEDFPNWKTVLDYLVKKQ